MTATQIAANDITDGATIRLVGAPVGFELHVTDVAVSRYSGNVVVTATTRTLGHNTSVRRYFTPDAPVVLVAPAA